MKDTDVRSISLATELCGLHLKNPLIAASDCFVLTGCCRFPKRQATPINRAAPNYTL